MVLRGRAREFQRKAHAELQQQQAPEVDGIDPLQEDPNDEMHMDIDEEAAMDEVMTNYFPIEELTHEGSSSTPHRGHPRERLWEEAKTHAQARLFEGARLSRLSAILQILNLQTRHGASNIMLDDLFRVLHDLILPEGNSLPSSWKEAKKVLKTLGMEYQVIHACPRDCMLFRGEYKDLDSCLECGTSRYKEDMVTSKVPQKAMRYFPLIPRLLHTYRCSDLAELQVWHSEHRSTDGVMRLAVDSPAAKFVEEEWPEFGRDPRNVRLGLATDGISPFNLAGKAQPYSVWPVVLTNYNIPPWRAMRKGHLILSIIVPGPRQPTTLDVYLAPLVEELEELWEGVPAYDNRKSTGGLRKDFQMKAMILWTIHDYPGQDPSLPWKKHLFMVLVTRQLGILTLYMFWFYCRVWFSIRASNKGEESLPYMWTRS